MNSFISSLCSWLSCSSSRCSSLQRGLFCLPCTRNSTDSVQMRVFSGERSGLSTTVFACAVREPAGWHEAHPRLASSCKCQGLRANVRPVWVVRQVLASAELSVTALRRPQATVHRMHHWARTPADSSVTFNAFRRQGEGQVTPLEGGRWLRKEWVPLGHVKVPCQCGHPLKSRRHV